MQFWKAQYKDLLHDTTIDIINTDEQSKRICDDIQVYHDDKIVSDFTLYADGKHYSSTHKTLYFESALYDICKPMTQD